LLLLLTSYDQLSVQAILYLRIGLVEGRFIDLLKNCDPTLLCLLKQFLSLLLIAVWFRRLFLFLRQGHLMGFGRFYLDLSFVILFPHTVSFL